MDFGSIPFVARATPPSGGGPELLGVVVLSLTASASPGAQSITVPAGTDAVVVMARATGVDLTITSSFAGSWTGVAGHPSQHFQHAQVASTGSQTITPSWTASPSEGPVFFVFFVGGVDSSAVANWVRDAVQDEVDTVVLDTEPGDLVIVLDNAYAPTGDIPGAQAGYTSHGTLNYNNLGGRARSLDTVSGPTTTINHQPGPVNTAYHGLCAMSIFG